MGRRRAGSFDPGVVSYIDENLLPDEHVVYRAKLHGIIFARAVVVLVVGVVLLIVLPGVPLARAALLAKFNSLPTSRSTLTRSFWLN